MVERFRRSSSEELRPAMGARRRIEGGLAYLATGGCIAATSKAFIAASELVKDRNIDLAGAVSKGSGAIAFVGVAGITAHLAGQLREATDRYDEQAASTAQPSEQ